MNFHIFAFSRLKKFLHEIQYHRNFFVENVYDGEK